MFGQNEIAGRKTFVDAGDRLLVTSMFLTLQGEGPFQGRPAVFVRLAKCNLACSFCDTWFDKGDWWQMRDLHKAVLGHAVAKYAHGHRKVGVVITGGEPSLQTNLSKFMHMLVEDRFAFTQIESNGILPIEGLPQSTVLVVSPKCHEDTNGPTSYLKPRQASLDRADCLKFVMSAEQDIPYSEVPAWALAWRRETGRPIYVSPMNVYNKMPEIARSLLAGEQPTLEERNKAEVISFWEPDLLDMQQNKLNHEYAARYALNHGLFLTLQQHLYASLP